MPITDADRTIAGTSSQIAPSGFHAKPTIVVDLAHSPSAKSELVAKSCPPAFLFASSRAKAKGTDQKSDKMPDITASAGQPAVAAGWRSEEHTSELQSLMRISYAVFCLKKKKTINRQSKQRTHKTT